MPLHLSFQKAMSLIGVGFGRDRHLGLHQEAYCNLIVLIHKSRGVR